jgi:CheY-specific phosphatase CheX
MAEKRTIELEVNSNLGSLKSQLKEAQQEVQNLSEKFGATSTQAVEAAKSAAILKDKIGDAKALTDAFNPDAKFKALSGSLTGVASGFSVVTGAMGAFGAQSEGVEKALLKVQSAMAMAQGLQGLGESIDSFKQLKAVVVSAITGITTAKVAETTATEAGVIAENQGLLARGKNLVISAAQAVLTPILTAGQYAYNLAMSLNPIGAIVIAVTALIVAGYALINMFMASNKANESATNATKKSSAAIDAQVKSANKASEALASKNGHEYNMAKASGASAEALRKLALKHADEAIALDLASYATAKNTYQQELNTLTKYRALDLSEEVIKKQLEVVNKAKEAATKENADLATSYKNKRDIINANQVEIATEKFNANKKNTQTDKGSAVEVENITRDLQDKKLALLQDGQAKESQIIQLKYARENEDLGKQVKAKTLKQTDADKLTATNLDLLEKELQAIRDKYAKEKIAKEDEQWLASQKLVLSAREYEELLLAQKFDSEQEKAVGNAELQAQLTTQHEEELKALKVKFAGEDLKIAQDLAKAKLDAEKQYNALVLSEDELARLNVQTKADSELLILKTNFDNKLISQEQYETAKKALTEKTNVEINKLDEEADKKKTDLRTRQLEAVKGGLTSISNIAELFAGKSKKSQKRAFDIQKATNIASATIDTYMSATSAFKSVSGIPVVGPVLAPLAAAGAIAAGLINVKKIASTKFEGGAVPSGGDTGGGGGETGGGGAPQAPQFNVVGNNGMNQLAQLQQKPVQAFVVSSEMTSAQALERNRINNATI